MPQRRPIEMRGRKATERTRRRILAIAGIAGSVALAIAIGAVLVGTFPRPGMSSSSSRAAGPTPKAPAIAASTAPTASIVDSSSPPLAQTSTRPADRKPAPKAGKRPAAKAPEPVALPLGMARVLPGSKQIIVATGGKIGATHGTLRVFDLAGGEWRQVLSAPCRFGTYGLVDGAKRKEGSRMTPTGIWWPGAWVWGWHASAPAGTQMPYRQTTENVWWSDERNSTYNTWVVSTKHVSGEHLVDVRVQYEFALSTGYNSPPNQVVRGRGTAIFLHVFDPPDYHKGLSAGCVAIARADMIRVFQTMNPALKPCFAIGTAAPGTPASIASY